jgi:hypothetical protein
MIRRPRHLTQNATSAAICAAGLFVLALSTGCTEQEIAKWEAANRPLLARDSAPVETNIVRVNKFFSQTPWLSFKNDGSKKVDGVSFSLYLEGPSAPKGVFGTGTIAIAMYRLDTDPLGKEVATQVKEWVMTADEAYAWRSKKQTALGWGYGIRLNWGDEVDVAGKQIAIVAKYLREDGRVISSSRQVLKVPPDGAKPSLAARN